MSKKNNSCKFVKFVDKEKPFHLPKGFNPFKAYPVRDAFPNSPWAQSRYFNGYEAQVPVRFPDFSEYDPKTMQELQSLEKRCLELYDVVRRNDIRHTTESVREDIAKDLRKRRKKLRRFRKDRARFKRSDDPMKLRRAKYLTSDIEKMVNGINEIKKLDKTLQRLCRDWEYDNYGRDRAEGEVRRPLPRQLRVFREWDMFRYDILGDGKPRNVRYEGRVKKTYMLDHDDIMRYGFDWSMGHYRQPWYDADEVTIKAYENIER